MNAYMTPIGPIPANFEFMQELMRMANISYRDEEINIVDKETGEVKKNHVRSWFILADVELVPLTRRQSTGRVYKDETKLSRAANKHRQFCMIRDAIDYLCSHKANVNDVLLAAIKQKDEIQCSDKRILKIGNRVKQLWDMDWKECENAVVHMGVDGYQERATDSVF